jgi:RNA polymerase sigma-70 factor (ECF subfamily)
MLRYFKTGMEERYLDIISANKDRIYKICLAYAPSPEDAKDFFQEVLLQVWKSLPSFRDDAAPATWIYRVTLNVCMRAKNNAERTNRVVALEGEAISYMRGAPADDPGRFRDLYTCIGKLSDSEKSVVLLFLEDLSFRQISQVTGLTENHVAVKLKRIKKKLFNCLNS